jgi:hypothetical protein
MQISIRGPPARMLARIETLRRCSLGVCTRLGSHQTGLIVSRSVMVILPRPHRRPGWRNRSKAAGPLTAICRQRKLYQGLLGKRRASERSLSHPDCVIIRVTRNDPD